MLRVLYRLVLRAHPPYFRQRFAEEMQSIFDRTEDRLAAAGLLADAMLSLGRQWTLRPQFWEEPALAPAQAGPLFNLLDSNQPRASALLYGALLSALVLNGVCWTMGYAWNHPRFMDIRPGYGPAGRLPESKLISRAAPRPTLPAEPALYSDEGRVVLIFRSPTHPAANASPADKASTPATTTPRSPADSLSPSANLAVDVPPDVLRSYAGTYVANSAEHERVVVTLDGGRLQMEVVGAFRSPLTPLGKPQLLACGAGDCWVAFSSSASGTADRIEVHYGGREIQAFRAQGAVF